MHFTVKAYFCCKLFISSWVTYQCFNSVVCRFAALERWALVATHKCDLILWASGGDTVLIRGSGRVKIACQFFGCSLVSYSRCARDHRLKQAVAAKNTQASPIMPQLARLTRSHQLLQNYRIVARPLCNSRSFLSDTQLWQRSRATLRVLEHFAKSLMVTQDHSNIHRWLGHL